jgi:hypothetical protein
LRRLKSRGRSEDVMKYITLVVIALLAAAGAEGPEPRYHGPGAGGPLRYEPGVGITRKDALPSTDEQAQYALVLKAFEEQRWEATIVLSIAQTQSWPEGSRVVESILMRVRARLELGRDQDPEEGLAQTITLERWLFLYLAPINDDRLQQLIARDAQTRAFISELRQTSVNEFVTRLTPDADALYDSGHLGLALADCRTLLTYYLPVLELRRFRAEVAELTRDVAWLMYAARAFDAVIDISLDLLAMNPSPAVKADALFIQGQAQRRNGAHFIAANTFGLLFNGAGLRDTDTRWRPHALMWQINETMEASKGPGYDQVPYERALELLGEYELYAIENPNIDEPLHEEFIALMDKVYTIMIQRDLTSADTYSRLGESGAEEYYIASAAKWEAERDARIAELRKAQ